MSRNNLQQKLQVGSIVSLLGQHLEVFDIKRNQNYWRLPKAEISRYMDVQVLHAGEKVWVKASEVKLLSFRETVQVQQRTC